jgi:hypothetical protein
LETLPKRKIDNATYVDGGTKFKLKSKDGPTVFVKREGGKERQDRKMCKKCGLLVAYVCDPKTDKMYLVAGSLLREDEKPSNATFGRSAQDAGLEAVPELNPDGSGGAAAGGSAGGAAGANNETVFGSEMVDEELAEANQLAKNYDSNAEVIEKMIGRSVRDRPAPWFLPPILDFAMPPTTMQGGGCNHSVIGVFARVGRC